MEFSKASIRDLFGNYYLAPIDRFLEEYGVVSARYVDDVYVFVESVEATDQLLLIPTLRSYDLVLCPGSAPVRQI